ncbi:hypothetical protein ALISP_6900 [Alicycliphilus sp. B1]|nr:hypothetical protein ALISP_6900 [Alicycliphilus sp. B1]
MLRLAAKRHSGSGPSAQTLDTVTMEPYLFYGVVLPERAQLTLQFSVGFSHIASGLKALRR